MRFHYRNKRFRTMPRRRSRFGIALRRARIRRRYRVSRGGIRL